MDKLNMSSNNELDKQQRRTMAIVMLYPVGILLAGIALNFFLLGVNPYVISLPSDGAMYALIIAVVLLIVNHTWIMTSTELVRVRFKMYSTPEEWVASGTNEKNAPELGVRELKRRHDIHHNTTENVVCYVLLSLIFAFSSPTLIAAQVWIIGFAIARLGYTYSYLTGKDNVRGLFMTLGLLAMFGMASNLVISCLIGKIAWF